MRPAFVPQTGRQHRRRDGLVQRFGRQHRQLGDVADGHAALHAAGDDLLRHLVEMPPARVGVEIEVAVEIQAEVLRHGEDPRDMPPGIAVGVGAAAEQVGARAQRLPQQLFGAAVVAQLDQPLSGKPLQRLPDQRAAGAEALAQRILGQLHARQQGALEDGRAQRGADQFRAVLLCHARRHRVGLPVSRLSDAEGRGPPWPGGHNKPRAARGGAGGGHAAPRHATLRRGPGGHRRETPK